MPPPEPELDLLQAQILVVPLLVACRVSRLPLLYMGFSFVYPPVRVLLSRPNLVNRRRPRPRSSLAGNCHLLLKRHGSLRSGYLGKLLPNIGALGLRLFLGRLVLNHIPVLPKFRLVPNSRQTANLCVLFISGR